MQQKNASPGRRGIQHLKAKRITVSRFQGDKFPARHHHRFKHWYYIRITEEWQIGKKSRRMETQWVLRLDSFESLQ
jgi:hypothetical protein